MEYILLIHKSKIKSLRSNNYAMVKRSCPRVFHSINSTVRGETT